MKAKKNNNKKNVKRTKSKKSDKKQKENIDAKAYKKKLQQISENIQQSKIKEDLYPFFAEAMNYMQRSLENKGYGKCEIKILANLPKFGWLQCRNVNYGSGEKHE